MPGPPPSLPNLAFGWRAAPVFDMKSGMHAAAASARIPADRTRTHVFYTGMSLVMLATVLLGFARSYFLRSQYFPSPLAPVAQIHGALFVSWILLFIVQSVLIANRRTSLHRRVGIVGGFLAVAMVVAGSTIALVSLRYNFSHGNLRALSFFAIPMGNMIVFPILVAAAIAWRRRPETHKRLMLLATISILDAAIARWPISFMSNGPIAFFAIADLYLLSGVVFDLASRKSVHPAYVWGGLLLVGSQILRLAIWHTAAWIAFARMLAV